MANEHGYMTKCTELEIGGAKVKKLTDKVEDYI